MPDTREEFERIFAITIRQRKRTKDGHEYQNDDIQAKWLGWQAREDMAKGDQVDVLNMLLDVARCAHDAMENTEDDGNGLHWFRDDFDALSAAMDKLDDLPDDKPGYVLGPAAKAGWALFRS